MATSFCPFVVALQTLTVRPSSKPLFVSLWGVSAKFEVTMKRKGRGSTFLASFYAHTARSVSVRTMQAKEERVPLKVDEVRQRLLLYHPSWCLFGAHVRWAERSGSQRLGVSLCQKGRRTGMVVFGSPAINARRRREVHPVPVSAWALPDPDHALHPLREGQRGFRVQVRGAEAHGVHQDQQPVRHPLHPCRPRRHGGVLCPAVLLAKYLPIWVQRGQLSPNAPAFIHRRLQGFEY